MATTQLSDVIVPEVYASYQQVDDIVNTSFFQSGIIAQNPALNDKARTGGTGINLPFWNDLDMNQEANIGSDNPAVEATPNKITAAKMVAYLANPNQAYSAADLTSELAGSDPMARIRARFATYWQNQYQLRLINAVKGILAANIAKNDGDMVEDISADTNKSLFNIGAFVDAAFSLGDQFGTLTGIGMHSLVYAGLVKENEIESVRASDGTLLYYAYKGLRIIVNDNMPVDTSGDADIYTSVLFGAGAFGYGAGEPANPVEIDRKALAGNGAGVESIIERKKFILHPFGYRSAEGASEFGQTWAELASADTWTRVVDRKQVPMAFLKTTIAQVSGA